MVLRGRARPRRVGSHRASRADPGRPTPPVQLGAPGGRARLRATWSAASVWEAAIIWARLRRWPGRTCRSGPRWGADPFTVVPRCSPLASALLWRTRCGERSCARREHKSTKSRAGRRTIGLPDPLIKILRQHQEAQERERIAAGADWSGKGYVFASPVGGALSPSTDFHTWKRLLRDAGVRNGRLHDVRHTAATVLLRRTETETETDNDEGPHRERWGPSTSCPVRHWRRIRDSNS